MKIGNILICIGVLYGMLQLERMNPQFPIYQKVVKVIEVKP